MSPLIFLGAASGLCWGTADFFGGVQSRRMPALAVVFWSQVAGATALALLLLLRGEHPVPSSIAWGAAAGLFGGSALIFFYRGLAVGAMSIVAPVSACGAAVPVLFAIATGHIPSVVTLVGIGTIMTAIVLVSLHGDASVHPAGRPHLSLALALLAALGFGMFYVFAHQGSLGSGGSPFWTIAGARGGSLLTVLAILLVGRQRASWPAGRMPLVAGVGVADTTANVLFAYASIQGNLGVAAVLGSLYPVATVLLGRVVLGERLPALQQLAIVGALAGVALLSIGS
ncbi:MAG TPA: EamA family transporter [Chloroflexota bacterium]|nr:EamA family transporter [Chloroflexota bacterium]